MAFRYRRVRADTDHPLTLKWVQTIKICLAMVQKSPWKVGGITIAIIFSQLCHTHRAFALIV